MNARLRHFTAQWTAAAFVLSSGGAGAAPVPKAKAPAHVGNKVVQTNDGSNLWEGVRSGMSPTPFLPAARTSAPGDFVNNVNTLQKALKQLASVEANPQKISDFFGVYAGRNLAFPNGALNSFQHIEAKLLRDFVLAATDPAVPENIPPSAAAWVELARARLSSIGQSTNTRPPVSVAPSTEALGAIVGPLLAPGVKVDLFGKKIPAILRKIVALEPLTDDEQRLLQTFVLDSLGRNLPQGPEENALLFLAAWMDGPPGGALDIVPRDGGLRGDAAYLMVPAETKVRILDEAVVRAAATREQRDAVDRFTTGTSVSPQLRKRLYGLPPGYHALVADAVRKRPSEEIFHNQLRDTDPAAFFEQLEKEWLKRGTVKDDWLYPRLVGVLGCKDVELDLQKLRADRSLKHPVQLCMAANRRNATQWNRSKKPEDLIRAKALAMLEKLLDESIEGLPLLTAKNLAKTKDGAIVITSPAELRSYFQALNDTYSAEKPRFDFVPPPFHFHDLTPEELSEISNILLYMRYGGIAFRVREHKDQPGWKDYWDLISGPNGAALAKHAESAGKSLGPDASGAGTRSVVVRPSSIVYEPVLGNLDAKEAKRRVDQNHDRTTFLLDRLADGTFSAKDFLDLDLDDLVRGLRRSPEPLAQLLQAASSKDPAWLNRPLGNDLRFELQRAVSLAFARAQAGRAGSSDIHTLPTKTLALLSPVQLALYQYAANDRSSPPDSLGPFTKSTHATLKAAGIDLVVPQKFLGGEELFAFDRFEPKELAVLQKQLRDPAVQGKKLTPEAQEALEWLSFIAELRTEKQWAVREKHDWKTGEALAGERFLTLHGGPAGLTKERARAFRAEVVAFEKTLAEKPSKRVAFQFLLDRYLLNAVSPVGGLPQRLRVKLGALNEDSLHMLAAMAPLLDIEAFTDLFQKGDSAVVDAFFQQQKKIPEHDRGYAFGELLGLKKEFAELLVATFDEREALLGALEKKLRKSTGNLQLMAALAYTLVDRYGRSKVKPTALELPSPHKPAELIALLDKEKDLRSRSFEASKELDVHRRWLYERKRTANDFDWTFGLPSVPIEHRVALLGSKEFGAVGKRTTEFGPSSLESTLLDPNSENLQQIFDNFAPFDHPLRIASAPGANDIEKFAAAKAAAFSKGPLQTTGAAYARLGRLSPSLALQLRTGAAKPEDSLDPAQRAHLDRLFEQERALGIYAPRILDLPSLDGAPVQKLYQYLGAQAEVDDEALEKVRELEHSKPGTFDTNFLNLWQRDLDRRLDHAVASHQRAVTSRSPDAKLLAELVEPLRAQQKALDQINCGSPERKRDVMVAEVVRRKGAKPPTEGELAMAPITTEELNVWKKVADGTSPPTALDAITAKKRLFELYQLKATLVARNVGGPAVVALDAKIAAKRTEFWEGTKVRGGPKDGIPVREHSLANACKEFATVPTLQKKTITTPSLCIERYRHMESLYGDKFMESHYRDAGYQNYQCRSGYVADCSDLRNNVLAMDRATTLDLAAYYFEPGPNEVAETYAEIDSRHPGEKKVIARLVPEEIAKKGRFASEEDSMVAECQRSIRNAALDRLRLPPDYRDLRARFLKADEPLRYAGKDTFVPNGYSVAMKALDEMGPEQACRLNQLALRAKLPMPGYVSVPTRGIDSNAGKAAVAAISIPDGDTGAHADEEKTLGKANAYDPRSVVQDYLKAYLETRATDRLPLLNGYIRGMATTESKDGKTKTELPRGILYQSRAELVNSYCLAQQGRPSPLFPPTPLGADGRPDHPHWIDISAALEAAIFRLEEHVGATLNGPSAVVKWAPKSSIRSPATSRANVAASLKNFCKNYSRPLKEDYFHTLFRVDLEKPDVLHHWTDEYRLVGLMHLGAQKLTGTEAHLPLSALNAVSALPPYVKRAFGDVLSDVLRNPNEYDDEFKKRLGRAVLAPQGPEILDLALMGKRPRGFVLDELQRFSGMKDIFTNADGPRGMKLGKFLREAKDTDELREAIPALMAQFDLQMTTNREGKVVAKDPVAADILAFLIGAIDELGHGGHLDNLPGGNARFTMSGLLAAKNLTAHIADEKKKRLARRQDKANDILPRPADGENAPGLWERVLQAAGVAKEDAEREKLEGALDAEAFVARIDGELRKDGRRLPLASRNSILALPDDSLRQLAMLEKRFLSPLLKDAGDHARKRFLDLAVGANPKGIDSFFHLANEKLDEVLIKKGYALGPPPSRHANPEAFEQYTRVREQRLMRDLQKAVVDGRDVLHVDDPDQRGRSAVDALSELRAERELGKLCPEAPEYLSLDPTITPLLESIMDVAFAGQRGFALLTKFRERNEEREKWVGERPEAKWKKEDEDLEKETAKLITETTNARFIELLEKPELLVQSTKDTFAFSGEADPFSTKEDGNVFGDSLYRYLLLKALDRESADKKGDRAVRTLALAKLEERLQPGRELCKVARPARVADARADLLFLLNSKKIGPQPKELLDAAIADGKEKTAGRPLLNGATHFQEALIDPVGANPEAPKEFIQFPRQGALGFRAHVLDPNQPQILAPDQCKLCLECLYQSPDGSRCSEKCPVLDKRHDKLQELTRGLLVGPLPQLGGVAAIDVRDKFREKLIQGCLERSNILDLLSHATGPDSELHAAMDACFVPKEGFDRGKFIGFLRRVRSKSGDPKKLKADQKLALLASVHDALKVHAQDSEVANVLKPALFQPGAGSFHSRVTKRLENRSKEINDVVVAVPSIPPGGAELKLTLGELEKKTQARRKELEKKIGRLREQYAYRSRMRATDVMNDVKRKMADLRKKDPSGKWKGAEQEEFKKELAEAQKKIEKIAKDEFAVLEAQLKPLMTEQVQILHRYATASTTAMLDLYTKDANEMLAAANERLKEAGKPPIVGIDIFDPKIMGTPVVLGKLHAARKALEELALTNENGAILYLKEELGKTTDRLEMTQFANDLYAARPISRERMATFGPKYFDPTGVGLPMPAFLKAEVDPTKRTDVQTAQLLHRYDLFTQQQRVAEESRAILDEVASSNQPLNANLAPIVGLGGGVGAAAAGPSRMALLENLWNAPGIGSFEPNYREVLKQAKSTLHWQDETIGMLGRLHDPMTADGKSAVYDLYAARLEGELREGRDVAGHFGMPFNREDSKAIFAQLQADADPKEANGKTKTENKRDLLTTTLKTLAPLYVCYDGIGVDFSCMNLELLNKVNGRSPLMTLLGTSAPTVNPKQADELRAALDVLGRDFRANGNSYWDELVDKTLETYTETEFNNSKTPGVMGPAHDGSFAKDKLEGLPFGMLETEDGHPRFAAAIRTTGDEDKPTEPIFVNFETVRTPLTLTHAKAFEIRKRKEAMAKGLRVPEARLSEGANTLDIMWDDGGFATDAAMFALCPTCTYYDIMFGNPNPKETDLMKEVREKDTEQSKTLTDMMQFGYLKLSPTGVEAGQRYSNLLGDAEAIGQMQGKHMSHWLDDAKQMERFVKYEMPILVASYLIPGGPAAFSGRLGVLANTYRGAQALRLWRTVRQAARGATYLTAMGIAGELVVTNVDEAFFKEGEYHFYSGKPGTTARHWENAFLWFATQRAPVYGIGRLGAPKFLANFLGNVASVGGVKYAQSHWSTTVAEEFEAMSKGGDSIPDQRARKRAQYGFASELVVGGLFGAAFDKRLSAYVARRAAEKDGFARFLTKFMRPETVGGVTAFSIYSGLPFATLIPTELLVKGSITREDLGNALKQSLAGVPQHYVFAKHAAFFARHQKSMERMETLLTEGMKPEEMQKFLNDHPKMAQLLARRLQNRYEEEPAFREQIDQMLAAVKQKAKDAGMEDAEIAKFDRQFVLAHAAEALLGKKVGSTLLPEDLAAAVRQNRKSGQEFNVEAVMAEELIYDTIRQQLEGIAPTDRVNYLANFQLKEKDLVKSPVGMAFIRAARDLGMLSHADFTRLSTMVREIVWAPPKGDGVDRPGLGAAPEVPIVPGEPGVGPTRSARVKGAFSDWWNGNRFVRTDHRALYDTSRGLGAKDAVDASVKQTDLSQPRVDGKPVTEKVPGTEKVVDGKRVPGTEDEVPVGEQFSLRIGDPLRPFEILDLRPGEILPHMEALRPPSYTDATANPRWGFGKRPKGELGAGPETVDWIRAREHWGRMIERMADEMGVDRQELWNRIEEVRQVQQKNPNTFRNAAGDPRVAMTLRQIALNLRHQEKVNIAKKLRDLGPALSDISPEAVQARVASERKARDTYGDKAKDYLGREPIVDDLVEVIALIRKESLEGDAMAQGLNPKDVEALLVERRRNAVEVKDVPPSKERGLATPPATPVTPGRAPTLKEIYADPKYAREVLEVTRIVRERERERIVARIKELGPDYKGVNADDVRFELMRQREIAGKANNGRAPERDASLKLDDIIEGYKKRQDTQGAFGRGWQWAARKSNLVTESVKDFTTGVKVKRIQPVTGAIGQKVPLKNWYDRIRD